MRERVRVSDEGVCTTRVRFNHWWSSKGRQLIVPTPKIPSQTPSRMLDADACSWRDGLLALGRSPRTLGAWRLALI